MIQLDLKDWKLQDFKDPSFQAYTIKFLQTVQVQNSALQVTSFMTLSKFLKLSVFSFFIGKNGDRIIILLIS